MKVKLNNLADATEITERQKMAIWLAIQNSAGNITLAQALDAGRDFNEYMNENPESSFGEYIEQ